MSQRGIKPAPKDAIARDLPPVVAVVRGACSVCPRGHDVALPIVRLSHPDAPKRDGIERFLGVCARCIDVLATQGREALRGR